MKGGWWALQRSIEEEAEGAIDAKDEVVKGKAKDAGDGEAEGASEADEGLREMSAVCWIRGLRSARVKGGPGGASGDRLSMTAFARRSSLVGSGDGTSSGAS